MYIEGLVIFLFGGIYCGFGMCKKDYYCLIWYCKVWEIELKKNWMNKKGWCFGDMLNISRNMMGIIGGETGK